MEETPTNVEELEDETSFANLEQNRDDNSSELEESSDEEEEEKEQQQREEEIEEVEKVEEESVGDSDIEINYNIIRRVVIKLRIMTITVTMK